jgi:hypothetical protein
MKFGPQMVIGIQHLQTPISSFMVQKMHFQREQTIRLVIKSTCAQNTKEACAHPQVENAGKEHRCPIRDCGCKTLCTPKNDAFMILVDLPPTSGSSPKSI